MWKIKKKIYIYMFLKNVRYLKVQYKYKKNYILIET